MVYRMFISLCKSTNKKIQNGFPVYYIRCKKGIRSEFLFMQRGGGDYVFIWSNPSPYTPRTILCEINA